jgi:hypothetical protein
MMPNLRYCQCDIHFPRSGNIVGLDSAVCFIGIQHSDAVVIQCVKRGLPQFIVRNDVCALWCEVGIRRRKFTVIGYAPCHEQQYGGANEGSKN